MTLTQKVTYALKVFAVNVVIILVIIAIIDVLFFDKKIPKNLSQYHQDLDIFTSKGNLNEMWPYEYYQIPYEKRVKGSYNIITDEEGFRIGPKRLLQNNKKNIVMLGDSFSFGAHAEFDQSIQGLLQEHYPDYNIWNLSVSGTSTYYYDDILSYYLKKKNISSDILVIGLYVDMQIGDIPRVLARKKYGGMKAYDGIIVSPSLYKGLEESFLQRLLFKTELFLRRHTSLINIYFPRQQSPEFAIPLSEDIKSNDLVALEDLLLKNINEIQATSKLPPQHIIIWLVPSDHELTHKVMRNPGKDEFYKNSRIFWDNCKKKLEGNGYPVVDPREFIEHMALEEKIFPYTVDGHLNGEGYERIAGMIIKEIDKMEK